MRCQDTGLRPRHTHPACTWTANALETKDQRGYMLVEILTDGGVDRTISRFCKGTGNLLVGDKRIPGQEPLLVGCPSWKKVGIKLLYGEDARSSYGLWIDKEQRAKRRLFLSVAGSCHVRCTVRCCLDLFATSEMTLLGRLSNRGSHDP